jgi:hypothetical protein
MIRREIRGLRRFEEPAGFGAPNLAAELDFLAPRFRDAVHAAANAYRQLEIRYALIGGVAAGAYSRPRATKDVDFLVGDEAFESRGVVISFKAGVPQEACQVPIDNIPLHVEYRDLYEAALNEAVESDEPGVRIARPEMVAATKFAGGRPQDITAVVEMIHASSLDLNELATLVRPYKRLALAYERVLREWENES